MFLSLQILNNIFHFLQVNEVHDDQAQLEFLKKTGSLYVWPEKADIWWHPSTDIICSLQDPELLNEREQYRFNLTEIRSGLGHAVKHIKYI